MTQDHLAGRSNEAVEARASKCRHSTPIDWPGHSAVLKYVRCKNKTLDASGYCHVHRREHLAGRPQ